MRSGQRQRHLAGFLRQQQHLVPENGGGADEQVGARSHHLGRRIERKGPVLASEVVTAQGGADALGSQQVDRRLLEDALQRLQAIAIHRLADMGMIEHDQVVTGAEIGDRIGLEAFKRLLVPVDCQAAFGQIQSASRGGQRVIAARMVPSQRF